MKAAIAIALAMAFTLMPASTTNEEPAHEFLDADVIDPPMWPTEPPVTKTLMMSSNALYNEWISEEQLDLGIVSPGLVLEGIAHDMRAPGHKAFLRDGEGYIEEIDTGFLGTYIVWNKDVPELQGRATISPLMFDLRIPTATGIITVQLDYRGEQNGELRPYDVRITEMPAAPNLAMNAASPVDFLGLGDEQSLLPYLEDTVPIIIPGTNRDQPGVGLTAQAIVDSDYEYYNEDRQLVWQRQATQMSLAEQVYVDDINLAWALKEQWAWVKSGKPSNEVDCTDLKSTWKTHWKNHHDSTNRDFVVFLAQRDLESETSGKSNAGCAPLGGITSMTNHAYGMVEAGKTSSYTNDRIRWAIAHEVGHLYQGHHDAYDYDSSEGYTVMYKSIPFSKWDNFSDGSNYQANEWRIRTCAEDPDSTCSGMSAP